MNIRVPSNAAAIIKRLHSHGFEAYVVGGCVRDSLLHKKPNDWDITTSAKPEAVKSLFSVTIDTGIKHGTVTVMMGHEGYEVTTFRVDGDYSDGRHPDNVEFTASLTEDLKRRDFTINAMAYSADTGLVDEFGGIRDLNDRIIRAVGDPYERFSEDALRMLRALRFAAQLDFTIDGNTFAAVKELAHSIKRVSAERIAKELEKLLVSGRPCDMQLVYSSGLMCHVLPDVADFFKNDPSEAEKLLCALDSSGQNIVKTGEEKSLMRLRWSLLLLPLKSSKAGQALKQLKYDNETINTVTKLTDLLMRPLEKNAEDIRRTMNAAGNLMSLLFAGRRALCDAGSNITESCVTFQPEGIERAYELFEEAVRENVPVTIADLAVNGSDLMAAGIPAGKQLGLALNELLNIVLSDPSLNKKDLLIEEALDCVK